MFDLVMESLRKTTDSTVQMQQEMFKKWTGMWPVPTPAEPGRPEQILKFQKKWLEIAADLAKKQREILEAQFSASLKTVEDALRLAEVKDIEEWRRKTLELWQKLFEGIRQSYDAQLRESQTAAARWTELLMKWTAGCWAAT